MTSLRGSGCSGSESVSECRCSVASMVLSPVELAAKVFRDNEGRPPDELGKLQLRLAKWQDHNFGDVPLERVALGVSEEVGELHHAILKHLQAIRGMDDPKVFAEHAGDALADIAIFSMQIATMLCLDYRTLVMSVAEVVMQREWKRNG